jgi:hypothetical protein
VKTWSKTGRFWQYIAYLEKKWNFASPAERHVAFSPKTQSETVRFQQQRGICENQIIWVNFTFNKKTFWKLWTSVLSVLLNDVKKM